jgi:polycomb group RING finger protein 3
MPRSLRSNQKIPDDKSDTVEHVSPPTCRQVKFNLKPIESHLTCSLCQGYLKEALTISECLHSFCKSCLYIYFSQGKTRCPQCSCVLGPDPYVTAIYDPTLQELVDTILPELKKSDEIAELKYYLDANIPPKEKYAEEIKRGLITALVSDEGQTTNDDQIKDNDSETMTRQLSGATIPIQDCELNFRLYPVNDDGQGHAVLPSLKKPLVRTSGKLHMIQLKKFLVKQLGLSIPHTSLEIRCKGKKVGDEHSLTFVSLTTWMNPDEDMELRYAFASHHY